MTGLEIGTGALTAALVGIVMGLIECIKGLINKRRNGASAIATRDAAVKVELDRVQAEELHQVYIYLTEHKVVSDYLRNDVRDIRAEQAAQTARVSELISSTTRLVDRVDNLIITLNKLVEVNLKQ